MNTHHRAVAILHIVCGAFALLIVLGIALVFGSIFAFASVDAKAGTFFAGFGALIAAPVVAVAVGQIVAATYLLRGSYKARVWVIVFGVISLVNFPFGTALGAYTLWALTRDVPPDVRAIQH